MDIFKIGILAVITALVCVVLKRYNAEYAVCCGICGCIILTALVADGIYGIFGEFYKMAENAGINSEFIGIVLKITGISYIGQLTSEICRDAGEGAVATNVELCAKVIIMVVGMPVINSLFSVIASVGESLP